MTLEETYNIHKKINCVLPFFKSKWLCKKGIHNYRITNKKYFEPKELVEKIIDKYTHDGITYHTTYYIEKEKICFKCHCCGKEVEWNEK